MGPQKNHLRINRKWFFVIPAFKINFKKINQLNFNRMVCIHVDIPEELNAIDDECKAIYHSKDSVCFFIFKTRELRNSFVEETKGMMKDDRMKVYENYNPTNSSSV